MGDINNIITASANKKIFVLRDRRKLAHSKTFYLKKINQALQRIEDGAYGFCEECDDPISFERLMARPTADQCIGCKEEAELTEKGSVRKSSSMGKSFKELGFR